MSNFLIHVCKTELYVRDYSSDGVPIGTVVQESAYTEYEQYELQDKPEDLKVYSKEYLSSHDKPRWFELWQEEPEQDWDLEEPYSTDFSHYIVCYVEVFDTDDNLVSDLLSYQLISQTKEK